MSDIDDFATVQDWFTEATKDFTPEQMREGVQVTVYRKDTGEPLEFTCYRVPVGPPFRFNSPEES